MSVWLIVGLFLDGYAHENLLDGGESFVTPWHPMFYSGFVATVAWVWALANRRRRPGQSVVDSLPPGYRPAWTGLMLFGVGGAGDAAWRAAFGVETGIDALVSPTHLVLFAGLLLVLLSPWRAAFASGALVDRVPGPATWSIALATALSGFFANYMWGLGITDYVALPYDAVTQAGETEVIAGVGSMLVTTTILFAPAALILRRGRPPRLWFTLMFALVAGLVSLAFDESGHGVAAAGIGGAVLDLVRSRPWSALRSLAIAVALGVASVATWATFFALSAADVGISWPVEIWSGAVVVCGLAAFGIGQAAGDAPVVAGREQDDRLALGDRTR